MRQSANRSAIAAALRLQASHLLISAHIIESLGNSTPKRSPRKPKQRTVAMRTAVADAINIAASEPVGVTTMELIALVGTVLPKVSPGYVSLIVDEKLQSGELVCKESGPHDTGTIIRLAEVCE